MKSEVSVISHIAETDVEQEIISRELLLGFLQVADLKSWTLPTSFKSSQEAEHFGKQGFYQHDQCKSILSSFLFLSTRLTRTHLVYL